MARRTDSKQRRARLLRTDREHFRELALRSIADDSNDGVVRSGKVICPACRGVMHYIILFVTPHGNDGSDGGVRHGCLSVIGELPKRAPEPPPRRVSAAFEGRRALRISPSMVRPGAFTTE